MRKSLTALLVGIALAGNAFAAEDKPITIAIAAPGEVVAAGPEFTVKPNDTVSLQLTYKGQNLGRSKNMYVSNNTWLKITLLWLDANGKDVDIALAAMGFPPSKRIWEVADATGKPVPVAVNASVPGNAVKARVEFALLRDKPLAPASVEISDIALTSGQIKETGIPIEITGPADAGPLSEAPSGVKFGVNLLPNAALEEGKNMPAGWSLIGNNSGGAAQWADGGAYSGRHAFRIDERGPYVRTWDDPNAAKLGVPGGAPTGNYSSAREEVAARWVSEPVPAEPNALYQSMAAIYYSGRQYTKNKINPVRIQFLDKEKRVLGEDNWANGMTLEMFNTQKSTPGWVPMVGRVLAAPANAAWVRVVVALHCSYFDIMQGPLNKVAMNPGFVMVDNIALYRVSTPRPAGDPAVTRVTPEQAFADTLAAGQLPFVPTSPAHRPNSLTAETHTPIGAGILVQGAGQPLGLIIRNKIGDRRELTVSYDLLDAEGKTIHSGNALGKVEPYQEAVIALDAPADLPLGPYTVNYRLLELGKTVQSGESRLAVVVEHPADLAERKRMDYPFGTWAYLLKAYFENGNEREFDWLAKSCRYMGAGKQGFVSNFYPDNYLEIKDDAERRAKISEDIEKKKKLIDALAAYGVNVLPLLQPVAALTDETRPRAVELVTMLVNGLADRTLVWTYADEIIPGDMNVNQLDETRRPDGSNILNWGHTGSARKFIEDYILLYDAMKAAQPKALFGMNVASTTNGNALRLLLAAGAKGKFDLLGVNMFTTPFAIWPPILDVMKQNGMGPEVIWFLGQNFDGLIRTNPGLTGPGPERIAGELKDAIFQLKYWTQMLHAFPQMTFAPQWDARQNDGKSLAFNERVTPAFSSYAAMTRFLGAGRFTQKLQFPGAEVYVRERSARPGVVGVAWATGTTPTTVELNVGVDKITVTDLWGNPREVKTEKGIVSLTLTDSPQYILEAKKIEPAPSVRIELAQASMDAAKPQFTVTLKNEKPVAVSGVLLLDPQAAASVTPSSIKIEPIPAGESRSYTVKLAIFDPTLDKPLPIKARFETDGNGRTYESVQPLNFHFAAQSKKEPKIDGDLNDWTLSDSLALVSDREEQLLRLENKGPWSGPEELSGKLWMQWDAKNLYLAAQVRDGGQTVAKSAEWLWAGDSIDMLIAPLGGREKDSPYAHIALGLVEGGKPTAMRHKGSGANGPLKDAQVAVRRVEGGYVYEAAIPWGELTDDKAFTPKPGHAITALFEFNGKDAGTRMMTWFNKVTSKDPALFGQIVLIGPVEAGIEKKPAPNLVPNGDFDDAALPPAGDLKNWSTTFRPDKMGNPSAKAYLTKDGAYKGNSLVIERLHKENLAEVSGFLIPVEPGQRYLIRAMIKAPMRQPSLTFSFRDGRGQLIKEKVATTVLNNQTDPHYNGMLMMNTDRVQERDRFHPVEAVVVAPTGAKDITIGFNYNYASGKAYFDNVEMYKLPAPEGVK